MTPACCQPETVAAGSAVISLALLTGLLGTGHCLGMCGGLVSALSLSPEGSAMGYGLFHASPRDPIWEYVLSGLTAELCFDSTEFRVSFIGHSHVALSFHRPEGEPRRYSGQEINAGVWAAESGQGNGTCASRG